ncbi:flagellar export chaperone FliS [Bacillus infantis]|uniref:flagellar export chaperone FliS n=1 Tax=Bacillus infantis TaxID=324767 RepID=UPI002004B2D1|nr:flagellar export chaperone FliS [Bacillus infantis]MCK6206011.1 flagellar export chaperone FliS [Bacillus infantis]
MAITNPYSAYKSSSVNTASPGELTLMLYNGCLKFIHQAKSDIIENKLENKHTNIIKAQNIVNELMVTLNMDYHVSKNLMGLYDYLRRRLVEANLKNDTEILDEVEGFVTEFRDTWKQVIQENRQSTYTESGRV